MSTPLSSQEHTIAFYNIENLFDTENDRFTDDDDFLPDSRKRWTKKRYFNKLRKIGSVIATIGDEEQEEAPSLVGLAEVENQSVLSDLLEHSVLKELSYDFVHFDSSDERGIDVALLYDTRYFELIEAEPLSVYLEDEEGQRDHTRDILHVKGALCGQELHLFVNHWSSRREGAEATEYKRMAACERLLDKITEIYMEDTEAGFIILGDFNDNPNDLSLSTLEKEADLFNPFKHLWSPRDKGSLNHDFEWNLFDQILFSQTFLSPQSSLEFVTADIFDERFVTRFKGRFRGQPFRTYVGKRYLGGYSDHFPVYIKFKIQQ
jgi:endonuclease/exonuclease/phosphatase family metal-dependent hydrolase